MWEFEHNAQNCGYTIIAGVDEAGRGPLAGPVVSAAVILPGNFSVTGIDDSKKLSEKTRAALFPLIKHQALAVGTGIASHLEIDQLNILQASLLSMKRAVENLFIRPDFLLIDGKFKIDSSINQMPIVKGDSKSISIAAASIIAKVTRDAIMTELHKTYPEYNFLQHKGYPTKAHKAAVLEYGPCPVHRRSFRGVKEVSDGNG
ncbi:MAG: ribonuclease HII [Proteobacteria bacterium]|nr:ribonuclease HII [Pseudomonadota bacterium]MBU1389300.1 ribonuclease HII [Pseudomonadota bacterium]MBU1544120.1 ribonuclease HII [Pseudomonadota bacterium]MBU2431815.1 ribonuclease HII [Pseudomonadota bacterium]